MNPTPIANRGRAERLVSEGYFRKKDYESAREGIVVGGWGEIEVAYRIGGTTGWDCDWVEKGKYAFFLIYDAPQPFAFGGNYGTQ